MRFTNLLFSLFALLLATTGYSNRIYLDFDSGCMDVYEYQFIGDNSGKIQLVYHIKLNDREKVILETFIGKDTRLPKKPSKTRSCDDLSINERTVRQINSGDLDLYILTKNGRNYNVSMVKSARYAQVSSSSTGYSMPDARFSYKFSQPANGIDLASKGSNAAVYFKGTLSHECPKKYLFNKTSSNGDRNYTEFIVIPEIGIIEEKSGINENDAARNVKSLVKVNGRSVNDFVQSYCNSMAQNGAGKFFSGAGTVDNPSGQRTTTKPSDSNIFQRPTLKDRIAAARENRNNQNIDTTPSTNNGGTTIVTNNNPPPTSISNCTFYKDMDKGLYFDWSTGALANGSCGGNEYSNGYMLGGPSVNTGTTVITNPKPPVIITHSDPNPPVIINPAPPVVNRSNCGSQSRYGVHVVQKYETLYGIARIYGISHKDLISWNNLNRKGLIKPCMQLLTRANQPAPAPIVTDYVSQYHLVQRNETLYGIARKHGYTVDRLRLMNGLGSSDKLRVGQEIKVSDCNCPADSQVAFSGNTPASFNETGGRINTTGSTTTSSSVQRRYHVVKENDTIYSIAKKHGISVASLRSINDLELNEIIIPYQRIYLTN